MFSSGFCRIFEKILRFFSISGFFLRARKFSKYYLVQGLGREVSEGFEKVREGSRAPRRLREGREGSERAA